MPDNQPPNGGPGPYDGWDLEGVLSGEDVWVPESMRSVVGALAALRAAPARPDVAGEAAARALFRQVMFIDEDEPVRPGGGSADGRTLILPPLAANGEPRAATRPRASHRQRARRGRWQAKALVGAAAAAVVIVGGVALSGLLSGTGGRPGQTSGATSPASQAGGTATTSGGLVEGSGKPSANPTPSASGGQSAGFAAEPEPGSLCRQYTAFIMRSESPSDWAAESANFHRLSKLAGGPQRIGYYCWGMQPWAMPPSAPGIYLGGTGFLPPGDAQGAQHAPGQASDGQGNPGKHVGNANANGNGASGNGASGNGAAGSNGNGNGQTGNGSGNAANKH